MLKPKVLWLKKRVKNIPSNILLDPTSKNLFNKRYLFDKLFYQLKLNFFFFKYYIQVTKTAKQLITKTLVKVIPPKHNFIYTTNYLKKQYKISNLTSKIQLNSSYIYSIERFFFFVNIMLITIAKILLVASCMFPIGACAIAAGILFSGYNLAVSRNPEEKDLLFGHTLMWFAFIETFMFMGFLVVVAGCFLF